MVCIYRRQIGFSIIYLYSICLGKRIWPRPKKKFYVGLESRGDYPCYSNCGGAGEGEATYYACAQPMTSVTREQGLFSISFSSGVGEREAFHFRVMLRQICPTASIEVFTSKKGNTFFNVYFYNNQYLASRALLNNFLFQLKER